MTLQVTHSLLTRSGALRSFLLTLFLMCGLQQAHAQPYTVSGRVTGPDGTAISGVTVFAKNAKSGAFTDTDGNYSFEVLSTSDTLVFSLIDYAKTEVAMNGRSRIDLTLQEEIKSLDEVVIVGYGTQKRSDLTGSIGSVKADELVRIPTTSVGQALQGKVAGVQVTPASGEPGAGAIIRIRGVGTLNDASPLYVVDGMLLDDISFLNLNDVSSVEVLKDASATAIYGSRGANGVIIITTQKGQRGETVFKVNAYYGTQEVTRQIGLANANQYALLSNELAANEGRPPVFTNPDAFGEGTNWQDVIFRTAPIHNYQIAATGGSENMLFNISADYMRQEGIIRGSDFDRFTLRLNNEYQLTKHVSLGHNLALVYDKNKIGPGVLGNAYRADPTVAPTDSLGKFSNTSVNASVGNPEAQFFYNNNSRNGYRTVGNLYLDVELLKYFTFRSNFGLDLENNQSKNFVPVYFVSTIQQNLESQLNVGTDRSRSLLWENTVTFDREWKNHHLTVLGGLTAQQFEFEGLGGGRRNFPGETSEFYFLDAGQIEGQTNYNGSFEWSMFSYLFRTNYTLFNRFLFTGSFRIDGSSRFGRDNRYAYFPSFAAGWRISDEAFMKNQKVVNLLKLRASWGQIGNDKIGAYAGRAVVTSNLNAVFGPNESLNNGASLINLANPAIRWEQTTQYNVGIEIGILDSRLMAEVDYYNRITDDILVDVPIPAYVGAQNNPVINAAKVLNRGFDMSLRWRELRGKFSYNLGAVASTVYNEVLALGEGKEEIFGGGLGVGGLLGTRTVVGLPIGAFYGYQTDGIFQTEEELQSAPRRGTEVPGDLKFVDTNGDGVITADDRTYLGSPIPDLIYGFDFGTGYGGFEFAAGFFGQTGNKIINAKKMARFGTPNFETSYLDRWNGAGSSNTEPRVTNGGHNYEMSERFIEDGDFLRLRTVQVAYNLPRSLIDRLGIGSFRLYLTGTNLFTRSDFSGYTPEIGSNSVISVGIDQDVYPIAKSYVGGVNVSF